MGIRILSVTHGSPAEKAGILPEELIEEINHEPVLDEIDYQALSAEKILNIRLTARDGHGHSVRIQKQEWEPLGLCLDETIHMKPRHCRNHCLFCFIDQLPKGMRSTLYVKDDDWRLSMMMGNYVTLTNVDDLEFDRILRRKPSPLFISVHATDPDTRVRLLRNPNAGNLLDRLKCLKEAGIEFHSQIVLCPGINDGEILKQTIRDLINLAPASQSLAIVPIGLTKHREKLPDMKMFSPEGAAELIETVEGFQRECMEKLGTRFVYASDEFYCLSGHKLPDEEAYEEYPQIENGVGMLRQLERECEAAWEDLKESGLPAVPPTRLAIPTGTSAEPYIRKLAERYAPSGTEINVIPVKNRFFGESITVTGLIVARDLIDEMQNVACDRILISETMLKEQSDRFLDNMTLEEVRQALRKEITVVANNGEGFIRALYGLG